MVMNSIDTKKIRWVMWWIATGKSTFCQTVITVWKMRWLRIGIVDIDTIRRNVMNQQWIINNSAFLLSLMTNKTVKNKYKTIILPSIKSKIIEEIAWLYNDCDLILIERAMLIPDNMGDIVWCKVIVIKTIDQIQYQRLNEWDLSYEQRCLRIMYTNTCYKKQYIKKIKQLFNVEWSSDFIFAANSFLDLYKTWWK